MCLPLNKGKTILGTSSLQLPLQWATRSRERRIARKLDMYTKERVLHLLLHPVLRGASLTACCCKKSIQERGKGSQRKQQERVGGGGGGAGGVSLYTFFFF
eukprot:Sspe_Gene.96306::Locus_68919_Transcript_1_1_Confidence_1.000_Length_527::g.96306::m.96306